MKSISKLIISIFTLLALVASACAADESPLFEAVKKGDKAEVEALLAKGADVNAKDRHGKTPLHQLAEHPGDDALFIETIRAQGLDPSPFLWKGKEIAELLLTKGADVNAKDKDGNTPLHWAIFHGHTGLANLLLDNGADVNARGKDGMTPLLYAFPSSATSLERKDNVELLIAKGADVNARDNHGRGRTLQENAASMGESGIVELLQEHIMIEQTRSSPPRSALLQLTAQLKDRPDFKRTRSLIIKLSSELKPAPAIPEEARKHFVEGTAIVKAAKNRAQQTMAAQSFTEALKIAPWWGDAYYNLGVAQELAEKYDEAEQAFNFYLLSKPSEAEKREVQDRIYGLSAKRKLAGTKKAEETERLRPSVEGRWTNGMWNFQVTKSGEKFGLIPLGFAPGISGQWNATGIELDRDRVKFNWLNPSLNCPECKMLRISLSLSEIGNELTGTGTRDDLGTSYSATFTRMP